jgi:hypothetical protein
MTQSQYRKGIPTYLTLEQFNEFAPFAHWESWASAEALVARNLQLYFKTLVPRLSVVQNCPSKRTKMGNQKFTTPKSMEPFGATKPMGASITFLRILCRYCLLKDTLTL